MKNNVADFLQKIGISKKARPRIGRAVIALIIAQAYSAPLVSFLLLKNPSANRTFISLYTVIAYATIVLSILVFPRKDSRVLHDRFSLSVIALACFAQPLFFSGNGVIYSIVMVLFGIALLFFIRDNRKRIEVPSLNSVLIGLVWSLSTVVAVSLIRVFSNSDPNPGSLPSNIIDSILNSAVSYLTFSVLEEAYFRGLLFCLLVVIGWSEDKALLGQGLLFWGSHYLDIGDPIFFFVMVPLVTISTTLIIRKYKMLYMSVMVHLANNIFMSMFVTVLSRFWH